MGRHPNNAIQSLDSLPCLDMGELRRAGIFDPPGKSRRWNVSQTVADLAPFSRSGNLLIFGYHAVQIAERPCRFGGRRFYFECDCGQRVMKLYARDGGEWLCRCCHRLNYRSQMISPCDRLREKAQAIRELLGGSVSMFDPFPRRPGGMHRTRYARLKARHDAAADRSMKFLGEIAKAIQKRVRPAQRSRIVSQ